MVMIFFGLFFGGMLAMIAFSLNLSTYKGRKRIQKTMICVGISVAFACLSYSAWLWENRYGSYTVTEHRTTIDSGIDYTECVQEEIGCFDEINVTYQATFTVQDQQVTVDVSKDVFSRKPEQATFIQYELECKLKASNDHEKAILTDKENYDDAEIKSELVGAEKHELHLFAIFVSAAELLYGAFCVVILPLAGRKKSRGKHENKSEEQENCIV